MKNITALIITLFISISTFAQQGINYKALIKDDLGNVLADTNVVVQFTIYQGDQLTNEIYVEQHAYTTDANGIVILIIGTGNTVDDFNTIDWAVDDHFLNVQINTGAGLTDMGTTQFITVPYAKHAETAANVFSGDYNDLTNQPTTLTTGLERITESTNTDTGEPIYGWRLVGSDPANHGIIGENALDLSFQPNSSSPGGAIGRESVAIGYDNEAIGDFSIALGGRTSANEIGATAIGANTRASGEYSTAIGHFTVASRDLSTAMGYYATASGVNTTAMGRHIQAFSFNETAIGSYNTHYSPISRTSWNGNDKLFVIGNGSSSSNRNNALTVLKNGKTGIKTLDPQSLFEVAHQDGAPTSTNLTNAFSIRNLGGDNNANTSDDESWQIYTEDNGYLLLFRNGSFRGAFNATSGAYGQVSDKRVKKDITPIANGTLNKVMQLNPVSYLMKDQKGTKRNLGLISQEVQEIFPSITHYVEAQDILSLSYTELIPILIKALQEQQEIINTQNAKDVIQDKTIETLSADNSSLKDILSNLISRVEKMEANNK